MNLSTHRSISRRLFLASTGGALLAACGSSNDTSAPQDATESSAASNGDASNSDGDDFALIRYFADPSITAGLDRRLALGVADIDGTLRPDGPDELRAGLLDENGDLIVEVVGQRRTESVALPYYEFRVDVAEPALYTLRVDVDGGRADASFTVIEAGALPFPGPGDRLEPFDTPTTTDARGVDPICTREPGCPFHGVTLTEALALGKPVVYLIGTPAFCQTGTCGPILELLMEVSGDFDDMTFLHSEVFTDNTATTTAPAVDASGLTFEPAMFLVGADGVVVERLDVVVDVSELRERIALIA
ncbi:MAG: hypothetical protein ACE37B_06590 [Ilumatobacter sp.]|uniref:hypothetical protein n=1 Tax=Ilumatobacter sp. TaxID=1967498 RepID=UPI00391A776C